MLYNVKKERVMKIYIESLIHFLIIFFPLLISVIYSIYNKSLDKVETHFCEDVLLISIQYLLIISDAKYICLIMTIPLLLAIFKKRHEAIFFFIMGQICYMVTKYDFNISLLLIEGILLLILTKINSIKNLKLGVITITFILIKTIFFILLTYKETTYIYETAEIIIMIIIFIAETLTYFWIYKKVNETKKLFTSVKDIEENEQIRKSIFKISHEIKNPLAVCKGYLDMYEGNKDHTEKYVPIIKKEIEKTLVILQDFLSLTKTNLKKELMDVNYLIEDCLDNINLLLKYKQVKVIKDLEDDEIYINADYNRLHQVLVNVIKNSIEALETKDNKTIIIKSETIDDNVLITIEDNGIGLDKDTIEKIKEPFFTTKKEGTGLGVPLSIEIINAHDGQMNFKTIPNRKTIVTIVLPLEKGINNF